MASPATEAPLIEARAAGATAPRAPKRRRSRYTQTQRAVFVIALVTFTIASVYSSLVLFARAYPALFPGQSLNISIPILDNPIIPIQSGGEDSVFNERINVLVLGLDKRPNQPMEGPYLTDSIMVATIDPVTRKASALSIPRDVVVTHYLDDACTPGFEDRINTSYGIGWNEGNSFDSAAKQTMRDITCEFGIELDHYVVIDFLGVEELVDAVGGIDLDIPLELYVPSWYYSDEGGRPERYIDFLPGLQHLDGYHAVAFGRYREDSDLKRAKRQQLVLQGAVVKALGLGWLNSPDAIRDAWNAYKSVVKTDLPTTKVPGLGLLMKQNGGQISTYSLGDEVNGQLPLYDYTGAGGASLLGYKPELVEVILNRVFTKAKYADSYVEVQNGYSDDAAGENRAAAVARLLLHDGLPGVYLGDDIPVQATTEIILLDPGREAMALDIAEWLSIPATSITTRTKTLDTDPEIIVVLGRDFQLPAE
ncbi:MAG: LCP family protein [Tepidiformaceae bacterium]